MVIVVGIERSHDLFGYIDKLNVKIERVSNISR